MSDDRRRIRVFPDYGREWPLWENSTPTRDVGYATTPDHYGLSDGLRRRLAAWHRHWEEHFHHEDGWDTDAARHQWAGEGEQVVALLKGEVADFADVEYDPWPLSSG